VAGFVYVVFVAHDRLRRLYTTMTPADPTTANPRQNAKQIGRPKPKRPYSEDDQAAALAVIKSLNGNILAASRATGVPRSTLRKWKDGEGIVRTVAGKSQAKQVELAAAFERLCELHLRNASRPGKIRKSSARDSTVCAGIAIDKVRLLRGESTSINE
jgi:hypothetical protein